jgi:hypothetical protein
MTTMRASRLAVALCLFVLLYTSIVEASEKKAKGNIANSFLSSSRAGGAGSGVGVAPGSDKKPSGNMKMNMDKLKQKAKGIGLEEVAKKKGLTKEQLTDKKDRTNRLAGVVADAVKYSSVDFIDSYFRPRMKKADAWNAEAGPGMTPMDQIRFFSDHPLLVWNANTKREFKIARDQIKELSKDARKAVNKLYPKGSKFPVTIDETAINATTKEKFVRRLLADTLQVKIEKFVLNSADQTKKCLRREGREVAADGISISVKMRHNMMPVGTTRDADRKRKVLLEVLRKELQVTASVGHQKDTLLSTRPMTSLHPASFRQILCWLLCVARWSLRATS